MPLLIICSHCNHAVPTGDVSPKTRLCPFCSRSLNPVAEEADAPTRRGQRKRRTRLVMTGTVETDTPIASKAPVPAAEAAPTEPAAAPAPAPVARAVDRSGAGDELWAQLGRGATLVRAGLVVEWAAVSVFVVVVGAVLYLLAPDPRVPVNMRTSALHQELRVLGPPLVLLVAFGLLVGAALVAVGRVFQARAPWDQSCGRGFRATAACELVHALCTLAFAGHAVSVYFNLNTGTGGRAFDATWPLPILVLGLASRLVADCATVVNFGLASAALPSESLRRRTAAVAVALVLLGTGCIGALAAGMAVGAFGDLVRAAGAAEMTPLVIPGGAVYSGFTVYMMLGGALQHAARRAVDSSDA